MMKLPDSKIYLFGGRTKPRIYKYGQYWHCEIVSFVEECGCIAHFFKSPIQELMNNEAEKFVNKLNKKAKSENE